MAPSWLPGSDRPTLQAVKFGLRLAMFWPSFAPVAEGLQGLPQFHPQTVIRDWGNGNAFHLTDALTGVCVFGATGSGKTSGPAKHLAYGYLAAGFGGLVLCAKKEERRQWQQWAADTGRDKDLIIVDAAGKWRFNFLDWEASRPDASGGLTINIVAILDEIAGAIAQSAGKAEGGGGDNKFWEDALHHMNTNLVELWEIDRPSPTPSGFRPNSIYIMAIMPPSSVARQPIVKSLAKGHGRKSVPPSGLPQFSAMHGDATPRLWVFLFCANRPRLAQPENSKKEIHHD